MFRHDGNSVDGGIPIAWEYDGAMKIIYELCLRLAQTITILTGSFEWYQPTNGNVMVLVWQNASI